MAARRDYTLDEAEQQLITEAMNRDPRTVVRQRAQAIHLLHLGYGPSHVATMMAVERRTIYNWHDAWRSDGLAGLARKPGGGRKPKATPAYRQLLADTLAQDPAAFGYEFTVWTIDRLRAHLAQRTNITLSDRAFGQLLKREGYVWRRPKHTLKALQDPAVLAQAEAQLQALKKRPTRAPGNSSLWTKPDSS